jgi:glycerol-1-phosphate dehydrogenase [NAD(P)+]
VRNVDMIEMGAGVLRTLGEAIEQAAVLTMPLPWQAVQKVVSVDPQRVVMLESVEEEALERLVSELHGVSTVAGVGGGMAVDAGKYVAWRLGVPCISVPTVISTTAFANSMTAIRRNSQVVYVGDGEARTHILVVDFDVIASAPRLLNVSGVADLLAIHTACTDWEIACENGVAEHPLAPNAIEQARDIVRFVVNRTATIREFDRRAIKLLVDLSLEAVEIEAKYPRMGEGSEHFLGYLLELLTKRSFQHGAVVGMALDVVSALQGDGWHGPLCRAMGEIDLDYSPHGLGLSPELVRTALERLPEYVVDADYWYSVVNAKGVSSDFVDATLSRLAF